MRQVTTAALSLSLLLVAGAPAGAGSLGATSIPVSSAGAATGAAPASQDGVSPEQAVTDLARALAEGQPHLVWDSLPASYQRDITEIVHSFAERADAEVWNESFRILRKVGAVMQSQRDIILAMPSVQRKPGFDIERATRDWNLMVAPILTLSGSDLARLERVRTLDIRAFLSTTGVQFANDLIGMSKVTGDRSTGPLAELAGTKSTLISREGDRATVQIEQPGQPARNQQFALVEGKWIPLELAQEWDEHMTAARQRIAQMSPDTVQQLKPQLMSTLGAVDGTLDALAAAKTPQQFEQTMQMGMFQLLGAIVAVAEATDSVQTEVTVEVDN